MKWDIFALVLLYEIIIIIGIGLYVAAKARQKAEKEGFILASRELSVSLTAVTLALTVLGTVHILGLFEMSWFMGAASVWFSIAHVVMLAIVCVATGRWARRLGVTTIPELMEVIFESPVLRLLTGCAMAPLIWGILTLETQGVGIIMSTLTGINLKQAIFIGAILGILYVLIAGMREIAAVNLANIIVMYFGVVVGTIYLAFKLPAGWNGVEQYYVQNNQAWMTSIWGTPEILLTFALTNVVAVTFFQGISQMGLQTALAARNEETIRKALWLAAPLNGLFGVFTVMMGLAAKSIPEYATYGPKLAATNMLVSMLPWWFSSWLLATFLGAVLSTYAMTVLTPATIFVKDIYVRLFKPNATEEEQTRLVRLAIIVLAILALIPAASLPPIVAAILWLFSWTVPIFWFVVFGLFWKRSASAALVTILLSWIITCLWSFTSLPQALGLEKVHNVYVVLTITIVVGILLQLATKGKPGLFRMPALKKEESLSP